MQTESDVTNFGIVTVTVQLNVRWNPEFSDQDYKHENSSSTSHPPAKHLESCGNDGSRPGRDGRYSEHKVVVSFACLGFSHDSFNGFRSCTGLSRKDFPTRSFTALTIPPRPTNNSTMTPSGHFPRLLSSLLTITTSPTFRVPSLPSPLQLWRSLSADKYSWNQRFQSASL